MQKDAQKGGEVRKILTVNMFENHKRYFAFNIWDQDSIAAVIDAAKTFRFDVILQTSSRIFEKMEWKLIREFVTDYSGRAGIKAYLHLDHCRNIELIQAAVDHRWDSVMIDASHLPIEENIALTNQVCGYAHPKGVLVEAEVGQIQGVEDDVASDQTGVADMEDIKRFLTRTATDTFAAAIGTCHGLYKSKPHIRYDMIAQIGKLTDKPFVVHGGSGLMDADFRKLLSYPNVRKINISTELKQAYRRGILNAEQKGLLASEGFDVSAVKQEICHMIQKTAEHKLGLLDEEKNDE